MPLNQRIFLTQSYLENAIEDAEFFLNRPDEPRLYMASLSLSLLSRFVNGKGGGILVPFPIAAPFDLREYDNALSFLP